MKRIVLSVCAAVAAAGAGVAAARNPRSPEALAARAYVQDGLVLQFDAIENAGRGTHDSSATTWTELVSGVENVNLYDATWSADGVTFADKVGYGKGAKHNFPSVNRTLEGYITIPESVPGFYFGWTRAAGDKNRPGVWNENGKWYLTYFNGGGYESGIAVAQGNHFWSAAECTSPGDCFFQLDDEERLATSSCGSSSGATVCSLRFNMYGGASDGASTIGGDATYRAFRVYSRALTYQERCWNRAVDRFRFGGEDAAEAFTGLTPPDGLAAPDENGIFRARVSIASFADEPLLSFDGGNTWFATTNGWFRFGTELAVTVREDLRDGTRLTGPGVVRQPDGSYVVTVSGPVGLALRGDLADQYVSDGLVAFWDVQNNSGTGEMDFASKYWYDTLDATRYWTLGGSCNFSAATSAMEIPSGATCSFDGIMPTFVTCDTCMRWDRGRKFFNSTATTGFIFTQTGGFGRESQHMSVPFSAVSGEPDTFTYNSSSKTFYRRGFDIGRSHGFELQQYQGNAGNTLGGRFNTEAYFQGSVYALRLYSRDLTADETKRNAVLDGLRSWSF